MRNCRIADALNTYQYALSVIKKKGYKIFLVPDTREEFFGDFWAIKDKRDFIAADPLRLLGLIGVWEEFGDEWYEKPKGLDSGIYDEVLSKALPDGISDFEKLSDEKFNELVRDYQLLFEALHYVNYKISADVSRKELFEIISNYYKEEYKEPE